MFKNVKHQINLFRDNNKFYPEFSHYIVEGLKIVKAWACGKIVIGKQVGKYL